MWEGNGDKGVSGRGRNKLDKGEKVGGSNQLISVRSVHGDK